MLQQLARLWPDMPSEIVQAVRRFFASAANGGLHIDNEASLQHELGLALRQSLPKHSVRFEQPYTNLGLSGSFTKKEIDLVVASGVRAAVIELKFPRRGAHPNQMYKFCEDIAFLEELCTAGATEGIFACLIYDDRFRAGNRTDGIYGYFRGGVPLTGVIQNPITTEEGSVLIRGSYRINWEECGPTWRYCIVEVDANLAPTEAVAIPLPAVPRDRRERPAPRTMVSGAPHRAKSKYDPLREFLKASGAARVTLSFSQIEAIIGASLPMSARTYQAWWANQSGSGHGQCHAWLDAGFRVDGFDCASGWVRFTRAR